MKKLFILIVSIFLLQNIALSDTNNDIDIQINSLYAANKLDEAFNLIVSVPQDERTPQQLLIMGNIMMDYGKISDAEFMYQSAIERDGKFYKAYYNLGNIYLQNNQPNMAIDKYKIVLKLKKDFAPAYYNLGCAYLKLGEIRKAKNAFHDAVYFKPNVADYHYNLAYTYKLLKKEKDAQYYLDNYNKLENNN